jgi:hypothetical protein
MDRTVAEMQKELRSYERELLDNEEVIRQMQGRQTALRKWVHSLKSRIEQFLVPSKTLGISDHALIRYLERRHGIDMEEVKEEMRKEMDGAQNLGGIKYKGFVVQGNTVVTYYPPNEIQ